MLFLALLFVDTKNEIDTFIFFLLMLIRKNVEEKYDKIGKRLDEGTTDSYPMGERKLIPLSFSKSFTR